MGLRESDTPVQFPTVLRTCFVPLENTDASLNLLLNKHKNLAHRVTGSDEQKSTQAHDRHSNNICFYFFSPRVFVVVFFLLLWFHRRQIVKTLPSSFQIHVLPTTINTLGMCYYYLSLCNDKGREEEEHKAPLPAPHG